MFKIDDYIPDRIFMMQMSQNELAGSQILIFTDFKQMKFSPNGPGSS